MSFDYEKPMGYRWRSSRTYVIACVTIALFSENFLYSFIVPILQTILEDRLHCDSSETQTTTSALLSTHALVCFIAGPITGHFADKFPSRKGPLLLSLGAEALGTLIIAAATSLPVLFAGRIIQAIGGDAAWIVGFATIADVVGPDDTSRTLTTVSVFFMSGLLIGPLVSGILMQLIGYWPTWGTALAVLAIDVIMRCIMIDSPKGEGAQNNIKSQPSIESLDGKTPETKVEEGPEAAEFDATPTASETSSLLPRPWTTDQHTQSDGDAASDEKPSGPSSLSFYKVILTNPHALTGMAFQATSALILVSFDATLPLHVARDFGWNTSQTSLMFLFLQMPTFILSPLTGWLRDRVGPRTPTGVGYLLTALFLWFLGTPGKDGLFWGSGERGQAVYMTSLVGLGVARTLYAGSGVIEMTYAVKYLQGEKPHVFGPNGGFSKAYSLCNMSWTFGMLIGPVLLGSVNELAGYYYMNVLVAIISSVSSLLAFTYIGKS